MPLSNLARNGVARNFLFDRRLYARNKNARVKMGRVSLEVVGVESSSRGLIKGKNLRGGGHCDDEQFRATHLMNARRRYFRRTVKVHLRQRSCAPSLLIVPYFPALSAIADKPPHTFAVYLQSFRKTSESSNR